jgi:hypothetical protein
MGRAARFVEAKAVIRNRRQPMPVPGLSGGTRLVHHTSPLRRSNLAAHSGGGGFFFFSSINSPRQSRFGPCCCRGGSWFPILDQLFQ